MDLIQTLRPKRPQDRVDRNVDICSFLEALGHGNVLSCPIQQWVRAVQNAATCSKCWDLSTDSVRVLVGGEAAYHAFAAAFAAFLKEMRVLGRICNVLVRSSDKR